MRPLTDDGLEYVPMSTAFATQIQRNVGEKTGNLTKIFVNNFSFGTVMLNQKVKLSAFCLGYSCMSSRVVTPQTGYILARLWRPSSILRANTELRKVMRRSTSVFLFESVPGILIDWKHPHMRGIQHKTHYNIECYGIVWYLFIPI